MNLSQINLLPELSGFLKYGIIGLGAIVIVLAYYLLKAEQKGSPKKSSSLNGIYAFMGLGVVLMLIGLVAPSTSSKQESSTVLEGSNGNTVTTEQSQGDTAIDQISTTRLSQSRSNTVTTSQVGGKDTVNLK